MSPSPRGRDEHHGCDAPQEVGIAKFTRNHLATDEHAGGTGGGRSLPAIARAGGRSAAPALIHRGYSGGMVTGRGRSASSAPVESIMGGGIGTVILDATAGSGQDGGPSSAPA